MKDAEEWTMLLKSLHLEHIANGIDASVVSTHLAGLEAMRR